MKENYVRYGIAFTTEEQKDILIAMLNEWGIEGFEESEDLLFASGKPSELDETAIDGYLASTGATYSKSIIEDKNWNEVWESNFEPVQVEDFVGIRADFHPPFENVAHEIVITPKMSFGTGHHATTWLVLKVMQDLPLAGAKVFDFGSGTGILAIMAEKLGASDVLAVDYDDWCIENSSENFHRNNCSHIRLQKADNAQTGEVFDVILANINKNIILNNLTALENGLQSGGRLVLSGLLVSDEKEILASIPQKLLTVVNILEKNGWIAIDLQKQ